jgi:hypothetical protein
MPSCARPRCSLPQLGMAYGLLDTPDARDSAAHHQGREGDDAADFDVGRVSSRVIVVYWRHGTVSLCPAGVGLGWLLHLRALPFPGVENPLMIKKRTLDSVSGIPCGQKTPKAPSYVAFPSYSAVA